MIAPLSCQKITDKTDLRRNGTLASLKLEFMQEMSRPTRIHFPQNDNLRKIIHKMDVNVPICNVKAQAGTRTVVHSRRWEGGRAGRRPRAPTLLSLGACVGGHLHAVGHAWRHRTWGRNGRKGTGRWHACRGRNGEVVSQKQSFHQLCKCNR